MTRNIFSLFFLIFAPLLATDSTLADSTKSFYPTWKLMKPAEKKRFLAGYIHGWKDAKRVTDILTEHIAKEPEDAVESLEKVSSIYGIADIPVDQVVGKVTEFYSEVENHDAPLSVAVSSAR